MKKLLSLVLALCVVLSLCACGGEEREIYLDGNAKATIVIYNDNAVEKYSVKLSNLEKPTVINAMDYLKTENNVALTYTTSVEYGAYVTEFGSLKEDAASYKYIMFWTSVQSDWDVSAYATENRFNGIKLVTAGVGASTATLEDGAVIFFAYMGTETVFDEKGFATIVVGGNEEVEYTVGLSEISEPTVLKAMEYLKAEKHVALTYTTSEYGAYVTEFDSLKEDAANNKYIMFWTSVTADFDVSAYATEKAYKGTTLVSSGLGVSSASVINGAVIYFTIVAY